MSITISVFWVVLLIFIIHTIFSHLLNWAARRTIAEDTFALTVVGFFVEAIIIIIALNLCLTT